ncbi:hypothetical protein PIB30_075802 [Stylosanthes scabra]|uniref:RNase H type-1 domain-containing protein n=1 Tax=Stylosanthes scabra TaxID=79078 RepID=A0ABU6UQR9_9FABA|nr:hypothetical protein [Stylosanthes scabra]
MAHHSASEFAGSQIRYSFLFSDVAASWLPPPQGTFKINCDVFVLPDLGLTGFGCIIRNDLGIFVKACSRNITSWDSLDVYVSMVTCLDHEYVADKDLLDKILNLHLRSWDIQFEHVSRDFNTVVDFLAKHGAKNDWSYVEWFELGQQLQYLLAADLG